jgi:hypothetical protein
MLRVVFASAQTYAVHLRNTRHRIIVMGANGSTLSSEELMDLSKNTNCINLFTYLQFLKGNLVNGTQGSLQIIQQEC